MSNATLLIIKHSAKVWEHVASDLPKAFFLSKFYISADGDEVRIVEQGEAKRNAYAFDRVTIQVIGGGTFTNFATMDALFEKLEELGYPAFYKDGEVTGASIISALGFTPENVSNKVNNLDTPSSSTYPSTEAVGNALAGDTNRIPRFTGARQLGNSQLFDNGTNVGVGALSNGARLEIRGQGALETDIIFAVRNSANNQYFLRVSGRGDVWSSGFNNVNFNTVFGLGAGRNATGGTNSFYGFSSGGIINTGTGNAMFGSQSGLFQTTGNNCSFFGSESGRNNVSGSGIVALGQGSGRNLTSGDNSIFLGSASGQVLIDNLTTLTSSTDSIFIGRNTRANGQGESNQIVIGFNANGLGNNTVVLGNTSILTTQLRGNVISGNQAALATNATNGFLYLPTCAGVPTGTPTAITGKVPIVVDSTNNRAYIYSGGAWVALN